MNRILTHALLLAGGLMLAGSSIAQQKVYQWKDAQGRTHYSSSPPTSGKYTVRGQAAAPATPVAASTASKPESAQCQTARTNLSTLRGNSNVRIDSDGDGQPDRQLSTEEHAAQVKLAESYLGANCGAAPKN